MKSRTQSCYHRKFILVPFVMLNNSATGTRCVYGCVYECLRLFMKRAPDVYLLKKSPLVCLVVSVIVRPRGNSLH